MTKANIRIITPNDGDDATLTASPSMVATLPQTNLQDISRAKVARTTSLASQDIKGAWTSARVISAAAIMRHNLTSSGTWRLRLYSDAAWSTLVYDSGAVVACPPKLLGELVWGVDPLGASIFTGWALAFSSMFFTAVGAQSFTITLSDAANPAGYMEVSRLFIGGTLEPVINFEWGHDIEWRETTQQERTEGGTLRSDDREPFRRIAFTLAALNEGERAKYLEFTRKAGLRKDFFVSMFPGVGGAKERDYAMAAKLTQASPLKGDFVGNYVAEYVMEEA